jgi:DNA-binding PucR family transcriptional regulator
MASPDSEVQALVEDLSAELGRSVLVDDASLRLVAYSPTCGTEDEVRRTAILTRETPRNIREVHFAQGIATASHALRTAARPELGLAPRVCVPIRCRGTLFGYLWLIDADESLTADERDAAERCAAEIAATMYRHQELEKPRRELERRLVERLLAGAEAERHEAAHELLAADLLPPATPTVVIVALTEDEEMGGAQRAALELALDQFRRALRLRYALSLVRDGHGIVLVAAPRAGALAALAHGLHDSLGPAVALGYSDECEHLHDAHRAYAHAMTAARVAGRVPEHAPVVGWDELGPYRVLAAVDAGAGAAELLYPGMGALFEHESLVETLETYLDHAGDTKLTAEALFLHRASLYYRLQRIEEITGTSLRCGSDRLALHLSLKLAWLLGIHPGVGAAGADFRHRSGEALAEQT